MRSSHTLISSLFLSALAPLAGAQAETAISAVFPDFAGANGAAFHTNGDAKAENGALRLTQARDWISEALSKCRR